MNASKAMMMIVECKLKCVIVIQKIVLRGRWGNVVSK